MAKELNQITQHKAEVRPLSDANNPTPEVALEALNLSQDILSDIELERVTLTSIALRTCRLSRLINDLDMMQIMEYEAGGYPYNPNGASAEVWRLAVIAGRKMITTDQKTNTDKATIYLYSIDFLEGQIRASEMALKSAIDPDISISSANPNQTITTPLNNSWERDRLRLSITDSQSKLASRRAFIYKYVLQVHYQLKFSEIAADIFSRLRQRVDVLLAHSIPNATKRLDAVYDNLRSDNTEDWSNAVHSCRRILKDLADSIFPSTSETRKKIIDGKERTIKLGEEEYKNRIIAYVEDNVESERYLQITGSNLKYLTDRLDAIYEAACKGSHTTIVDREEAERYVIYTYMLVGDVLSLKPVTNAPCGEIGALDILPQTTDEQLNDQS